MVAIYVRQSVDKKDSISIDTQIDICKKEFDSKIKFNIYKDKGFSGKDTNRPSFENMMDDIKNGVISKVIVYRLDRISRSTLDFAKIIEIFKEHNIDFISTTEKFDTSTPIGKAILQIIMVFAELERETIQQRIKDNYYARGSKGFGLGGPAPYGYKRISTIIDGKQTSMFEKDPEQSEWLKEIFYKYADSNMSLRKIGFFLNDKKVLTPNKTGNWESAKISRILNNPVYVEADADVYSYYKNKDVIIENHISEFIGKNGCFLYGKRELNERKFSDVTGHNLSIGLHKGLINSQTWLACQYKLEKNKKLKNTGKSKHTWLSGLVKCGLCGYAMTVSVLKNGRYKYFRCSGKINSNVCTIKRMVKVEEIEGAVIKNLFNKVKELKDITLNVKSGENNKLNRLKLELIEVENLISNLIKQIAAGNTIVTEYINKEITQLDNRKKKLIEETKKINMESKSEMPFNKMLEKIEDWDSINLEDKKEIAKSLIEKVTIKEDKIYIDWKI